MGAGLIALPVETTRVLLAATGDDGLRPDLEPMDVTPGVVGFAVTALVVAGLIGLLLSMVVKLRRVNLGAERPAPPWADPAAAEEADGATTDDRDGADHPEGRDRRDAGPDGQEPDGGPPGGGR